MDTRKVTDDLPPHTWCFLDEGIYNRIYVSPNPDNGIFWVKKNPRNDVTELDLALSNPERVAAIWSKINPDLPVHIDGRGNWDIPYVLGTKPADEEIARTLLDIYKRTGYIIIDGCNRANFIKRQDGTIVCIDLDLAYHATDRVSQEYVSAYVINTERELLTPLYAEYFERNTEQGMGKSVAVIKYLFAVDMGMIKDENITFDNIMKKYHYRFINKAKEEKHTDKKALDEGVYATTYDIFLKLYRDEHFCREFPNVKGKANPGLPDIVRHAQKDKSFFGGDTGTCKLMKRMDWLNTKREVIKHSGLDEALHSLPSAKVEGIVFAPK